MSIHNHVRLCQYQKHYDAVYNIDRVWRLLRCGIVFFTNEWNLMNCEFIFDARTCFFRAPIHLSRRDSLMKFFENPSDAQFYVLTLYLEMRHWWRHCARHFARQCMSLQPMYSKIHPCWTLRTKCVGLVSYVLYMTFRSDLILGQGDHGCCMWHSV